MPEIYLDVLWTISKVSELILESRLVQVKMIAVKLGESGDIFKNHFRGAYRRFNYL